MKGIFWETMPQAIRSSPLRHQRKPQTLGSVCFKSVMSESFNRARRAHTPRPSSMAIVARAVITGKCQNNHTMVAADSAKTTKSAAIFVRADDESVMLSSPPNRARTSRLLIQGELLNDHIVKTPNPR
jgi:hypothetical protein